MEFDIVLSGRVRQLGPRDPEPHDRRPLLRLPLHPDPGRLGDRQVRGPIRPLGGDDPTLHVEFPVPTLCQVSKN